MNTLDSLFATDEKLENEGIEVPVGINNKGGTVSLMIGAFQNPKHEKALARHNKLLQASKKNPERRKEIMAKVMAEGVLFDWVGMLDDAGKKLKYTPQEGAKALMKYKALYMMVLETAADEQNYQLVLDEEDTETLKK